MVKAAGFPIQGSQVQNHWVAPRSAQSFIFPRLINWISWKLSRKSKLTPGGRSVALEWLNPIHKRGT